MPTRESMMPCPDLGTLRASLDDDAAWAAPPLRDHVRACASCLDTVAELRRNAELTAPALAMVGPDRPVSPAEVDAALTRFEQRRGRLLAVRAAAARDPGARAADLPGPAVPLPRRSRLTRLGLRARGAAAALVAVVVVTTLVATPGGRAAAAGFLAHFRSERFQVVALDHSQSVQLGTAVTQLMETGVFTGDQRELDRLATPTAARDRAAAARLAGFPVPAVDPSVLPRGVGAAPERILVSRAHTARLTFDRDRAIDYFRRNGQPHVAIPERFDGAQLVIQVPAIVVQQYAGRDGQPRMLIGKAGTIGMDADGGASLEELRELVLHLPGLPKGVVEQLRNISDWRSTLPLPVPSDQVRWRAASVGGGEALSFADSTAKLHALLWQRGGYIWGVAGVVGADEAMDVANSLG
jgi:hypothetical protein